jgi:hypothetical protein
MIAMGMSSALRDMPRKLRRGLLDDSPDPIEFPYLTSWYKPRERECKEYDRVVRSDA